MSELYGSRDLRHPSGRGSQDSSAQFAPPNRITSRTPPPRTASHRVAAARDASRARMSSNNKGARRTRRGCADPHSWQ